MDNFSLWWIVLFLVVVAVLQVLYILALRSPGFNRQPRQVENPILPNVPRSNVPKAVRDGQAPHSSGKIVVMSGLGRRSEINLPASDFLIGRFHNPEQEVLVALDDKSISRRHCRFVGDDTLFKYYLMDVGSSFGTFIQLEGQFERLASNRQTRIYNEDVVKFGNNVTVRFMLLGDTRAAVTQL